MVAFVFYSQIINATFLDFGIILKFENSAAYYFAQVYVALYRFWNLDFFQFILSPFWVSSTLRNMHIQFIVIDYVSAFFPLCLICITWIVIKLHYYNFKPIVWLWSKLSKCPSVVHPRDQSLDRRNSLIDVFTTFFLLSFSKLVYTSSRVLSPLKVVEHNIINNTLSHSYYLAEDPRIEYFGKEHLIYALISIFRSDQLFNKLLHGFARSNFWANKIN